MNAPIQFAVERDAPIQQERRNGLVPEATGIQEGLVRLGTGVGMVGGDAQRAGFIEAGTNGFEFTQGGDNAKTVRDDTLAPQQLKYAQCARIKCVLPDHGDHGRAGVEQKLCTS